MLGLSPYLNAVWLIAVAALLFPGVERLHKADDAENPKLARWTIILSFILAAISALTLIPAMAALPGPGRVYDPSVTEVCIAALTVIAGYSIILVLVSRLGRIGVGSGIGLIVLANTVPQLGRTILDVSYHFRIEGPEGMNPSWFTFQFAVAPGLLLFLILVACVALGGLLERGPTAILCVAISYIIASGNISALSLTGEQLSVLESTRQALGAQQPLHYLLLFMLVVAIWMLLHSGIVRKRRDGVRPPSVECVFGIILAALVTGSDLILSGLDISNKSWGANVPPFLAGYARSGPSGAAFIISIIAFLEITNAKLLRIPPIRQLFRRSKRGPSVAPTSPQVFNA